MKKIIYGIMLLLTLSMVSAYTFEEDVTIEGQCTITEETFFGGDLVPIGTGVINLGSSENSYNTIYVYSINLFDYGYNEFRTCFLYYGGFICR